MKYLKIERTGPVIGGWPTGVIRYYPYPDGLTCADEATVWAQFFALSPEAKIIQTVLDPPPGMLFQVIDCGGSGFGVVTITDEEWGSEPGGPITPPPSGNDPGEEVNVQFFTSNAQDDNGPL